MTKTVLLGEPPQTRYDLRFQLFGIPVRVHPLFWLVALILGYQLKNPIFVLIWIFCVFVSILIHEFGHALAARSYGWRPWITLYSFGGLASYQPSHHDSRSQIIISASGPGAGFMFIALVMAAVHATGHSVSIGSHGLLPFWITFEPFESRNINLLVSFLLYINIFWGLMNLLPVYPLDGGQISREICTSLNPRNGIVQSLWISIFTAGAIAVVSLAKFQMFYIGIMFGYFAYSSYVTLQRYTGRGGLGGPWGGGGGFGGGGGYGGGGRGGGGPW